MKLVIGYPPLPNTKELGHPHTGQNRQFQYFNEKTVIFPVILAYAATMLKKAGHDVYWMDGPAVDLNWHTYLSNLEIIKPDLIAWEVKTPTVKRVWPLINQVKQKLPESVVVLMGDHVTALPNESLENSQVDYVIKGGDYDFSLVHLVNNFATTKDKIIDIGTNSKLDDLPIINRTITRYLDYGYHNGNFKYLPGTYTMFGRDCWWRQGGGCTFCSWTNTFKNFRVCSVERAMEEIESCASHGIREVFDDSGTFPAGAWLHKFCEEMIKFNGGKRHGKARITMGCNMRPGALKEEEYKLMAAAGFRFILYGLESANYETLVKINKGQKKNDMYLSAKIASKYGLDPHATCMVGYSHETKEQAEHTINFTRDLFIKGYIKTLQATIVIPYPGTQLFKECDEKDLLQTKDWNEYGMTRPIIKSPMKNEELMSMTRGIYKSCFTLPFIFRKIFSIRGIDDIKYILRGLKLFIGHIKDFSRNVS